MKIRWKTLCRKGIPEVGVFFGMSEIVLSFITETSTLEDTVFPTTSQCSSSEATLHTAFASSSSFAVSSCWELHEHASVPCSTATLLSFA